MKTNNNNGRGSGKGGAMVHPIVSFVTDCPADIRIVDAGFASTTATVEAITDRAREFFAATFGAGAVSVEMPKSRALEFADFAAGKGFNS